MPTLTIRNLSPDVVERMKRYARQRGRSMEQEARDALSHRFAPRNAILDQIEASWETLPYRPSEAKVKEWITAARRGRPSVAAAVQRTARTHKKRHDGNPGGQP